MIRMKKGLTAALVLAALTCLTACGSTAPERAQSETSQTVSQQTQAQQTMQATDEQGTKVTVQLNDSPAAQSLAAQLPMDIDMENYSTNEKIFYPSQKLDTQQTLRAANKVGTLAYYEPWGDVVFFYDAFRPNEDLYELGQITEDSQTIAKLSGRVHLELVP